MTEPTMFTAELAADPSTPAQMLADIAAMRPDLRPIVATNPSAYPGLLEWLGSLGEPAVDAALAARRSAEEASLGQAPAAGGWGPGQQQPWQGQPQPGQPQPWQGQPQPGQPQPWQGQQQPGQPWQAQPYGYQQPAAPSGSGKKVFWIIAIVVGVLMLLGVGVVLVLRTVIGNAVNSVDVLDGTGFSTGDTYGDDPALDALWDACEAQDWSSCDDLYFQSPGGSDYEQFGASCGGRLDEVAGACAVANGEEPSAGDSPSTYGDDPALDALWDACAEGDMVACDKLWDDSPIGSEYERFGDTCGDTRPADSGLYCTEQ